MMQQVNLLPKSDKVNNIWLRSPEILAGIGVCLLFMTISTIETYRNHELNQQYQQLEQQLQLATAQLNELQTRLSAQTPDTTLSLELQQTQQRYQSLSHIVALLSDDQTDQALGFSRYLTALADQAQRDVWLTRIQMDTASNDISLHGSTFQPEQIPALLERLKNSTAFKGRHFASLIIQQNPQQDGQADFSVSSNLKSQEKSNNVR